MSYYVRFKLNVYKIKNALCGLSKYSIVLSICTQSLFAKYCATDKRTQPDIQKKVA